MSSLNFDHPMVPIAIVGMSCRLPGGANSPDELWELLERAGEAWSPVPRDRFNEAAFYHPSGDDPNGTNNHRGGHFIDRDLSDFDHSFFHLSPQQAAAMDPQQRILLEMSYEVVENAGTTLESCSGSNTAVYVAGFTTDFERNLYRDPLNLPVYYLTGVETAILSNRISHAFNFHGPSMTIDTGCSGGMVALHLACVSLRNGESDAAIVAAANLTLGPDHHIGMSTLHLTSGSGHSFPFDSRGDGYGRGEGCAAFMIKRLDDAMRDGNPIQAVIRNTATNQDGHTAASITYPNGAAQEQLIRDTYERAGLSPNDSLYVEAHGTGTVAGDFEELTAIANVFTGPDSGRLKMPLYVGSIKGNIGHTENTSGLASLIKASLILNRLQIPPTAGLSKFKTGLPLEQIRIPTELLSWPQVNGHRTPPRISINSFGFGGSNAHTILEKAPLLVHDHMPVADPDSVAYCPRLFVFSAKSQKSLATMIAKYHAWTQRQVDWKLSDLSYTLCHRRSKFSWRYSCVAPDRESLQKRLHDAMGDSPYSQAREKPHLVFIFTGQGTQWVGMGRDLLRVSKPFRDSIRASRDILLELGATWDLEAELVRPSKEPSLMNSAQLAQPITTAVQIALVDLLNGLGVFKDLRAVVGHSSGEIAAAYAAGYLTAQQSLGIAYHRGFMEAATKSRGLPRGAMLSAGLSETEALPFTKNLVKGKAAIACINSPMSVTISGDAEAVDEISNRLAAHKAEGGTVFQRRLLVDTAYHSYHMHSVADLYRERLDHLSLEEETCTTGADIEFFSSVSGMSKAGGFGHEYWTTNLVSPVRFYDAIRTLAGTALYARHNVSFIEVGPHPALAGPVRQCLAKFQSSRPTTHYLSVLQRNTNAVTSTLTLVGKLIEIGVEVNLQQASELSSIHNTATVLSNLPPYTWDYSQKHFSESRISREYRMRRDPYHDLLGVRSVDATSIEPRWRHIIGLDTLPWLEHHVIDSQVIFPGSGYLCMAIEAMRQFQRERFKRQSLVTIALRNVSFLRALVVPEHPKRTEMQLSFDPEPSQPLVYTFRVSALTDGEWREHCTGSIEGALEQTDAGGQVSDALASTSTMHMVQRQPLPDDKVYDPADLYAELSENGNSYGPTFSGVQCLILKTQASLATVQIPDVAALMPAQYQQPHLIHPSTLDTILHTGLPLASRCLGKGSIMPVHMDELLLSATASMPVEPGSQLEVLTELKSSHFRTAYTNISATALGQEVLAASGIELRSLSPRSNLIDRNANPADMCYELDWRDDVDLLRSVDLPTTPTFGDIVRQTLFKKGSLRVLHLGTGYNDLTPAFFNALTTHESKKIEFEFASPTSDPPIKSHKQLSGYPIRYRTISTDADVLEQGFEGNHYDVVITQAVLSLNQASVLVKPTGMVILQLPGHRENSWHANFRDASLNTQLSFHDAKDESLIVVARRVRSEETTEFPNHIQVLTHTRFETAIRFVADLENTLISSGGGVSVQSMSLVKFDSRTLDQAKTCVVIVDDEEQPVLSDPHCFEALITLLRQPIRIVWVSPDDSLPMHQITGVARTAHAENEALRLTVVHIASTLLSSDRTDANQRLRDLFWHTFRSQEPHEEREYRVNENGTILIPRLQHSVLFNNAVHADSDHHDEVEKILFTGSSRVFALSNEDETIMPGSWSAFRQLPDPLNLLEDGEVDLETRAFEVSKANSKRSHWAYAGVITRSGAAVNKFSPGEHVLAIGPASGTNQIRIPSTCVGRLPAGMSPAEGAGIFLNAMAASYALQNQARLTPQHSVLVHGALSPVGRAAIAVTRFIGARVHVTAGSLSEAGLMTAELGILSDHIIILEKSRTPRHTVTAEFDVILQAGQSNIPEQALLHLKPFGTVVIVANSSRVGKQMGVLVVAKALRNQAVLFCDLAELLHERPEMIADLVQQSEPILEHVPMAGLNHCIRPVTHAAQALRLIDMEVFDTVVLEADASSMVPVFVLQQSSTGCSTNATYLITGGLGDLGQRLLTLLARRGAKHLVTFSRRPIDSEEQDRLQMMLRKMSPDCNLHCISCDLTLEGSVHDAAVILTKMGLPPVRGIIQSAAVLQDRTLDSMTHEDFLLASRVKVDGTLSLDSIFASPHLEFFLMLSSAVNIVGASGQANYNAGNSVQDALAWTRGQARSKCQYTSLSIGWIEDAVHTVADEARLSGLRRAGLRPISHDELSRYLDCALGASSGQGAIRPPHAIIGFDAASLANATALNGNINSAMFCHIRNLASNTPRNKLNCAVDGVLSISEAMALEDPKLATDIVFGGLKNHLARLISASADLIVPSTSILSLGVDSLISIELRNWIIRQFQAPMQSSEILIDQSIQSLAEKVVSRSRLSSRSPNRKDSGDSASLSGTQVSFSTGSSSPKSGHSGPTAKAELIRNPVSRLPSLPNPPLEATLTLFAESRWAIESPDEQLHTNNTIRQFLDNFGPDLQQRLESLAQGDEVVVNSYEGHIYLKRREPVQDFSQFAVGHTMIAPVHSQATRATILTLAALQFARQLAMGQLAPGGLQGSPFNVEASSWMFYATRQPGLDTDIMKRFPPSQTVAVLRRGHVFQLNLPGLDEVLLPSAVHAAYEAIMGESGEMQPCVSTLTSDDRRSWAEIRSILERNSDNAAALEVLETSAFVVCLDDECPSSAGERHTQFLLNGLERPFYNRWQDKPVQLAVTANGLSASIFEHTKLDGMDVRPFVSHLKRSLLSFKELGPEAEAYPIRKLVWKTEKAIIQRINEIQRRGAGYGPLDHCYVYGENLGLRTLSKRHVPPHATVHMTVLLAVYLVDGNVRPAWEIASRAEFFRGRIDWVQTITSPVRAFIEAAARFVAQSPWDDKLKGHLRGLFNAATGDHTRLMSTAGNGFGYVGHLYALLAVFEDMNGSAHSHQEQALPQLFSSSAWNATRRGGPGQDLKIGFMPSEGEDDDEWDEGGFLMEGDRGIYVHCRIQDQRAKFAVSARPEYAAKVCEALCTAADFIQILLA